MPLNNCVKTYADIDIVILAAGKGTRMHSARPKVLQVLGDKPLLAHVLASAKALTPSQIVVVYGHGGEALLEYFSKEPVCFVEQVPCLGTGHAVLQALPHLQNVRTLVLYGDVPLISEQTLKHFLEAVPLDAVGLLTTVVKEPQGLGRVKRNQEGAVVGIVEEGDATLLEKEIQEVNSGIFVAPLEKMKAWLVALLPHNQQAEYYLTDIFKMAAKEKVAIHTVFVKEEEVQGVNTAAQLEKAERLYQSMQAQALLAQGVRLRAAQRFDIRGTLCCGTDVSIDVDTVFEGETVLENNVTIGPHCVIKNAVIKEGAHILAFSYLENVVVEQGARIGPFARLRPGTTVGAYSAVGNFVEIKNTTLGAHSKVNHLTYLGDASIGERVNIGAGTITCNYDGAYKHRTIIEDDVFIGSSTQLVAPVTVGAKATVAAGTTVLKDVPGAQLTLNQKTQTVLEGWQRPIKEKD